MIVTVGFFSVGSLMRRMGIRSISEKMCKLTITMSMGLLKILIDEKVNDEGGHGYRVVERLVNLGFSKKELMVLKFTESDIDRALQEGEEHV